MSLQGLAAFLLFPLSSSAVAAQAAPAASDTLSSYYDGYLGRYRRPNGCDVIITRTLRRLWARDSCTLAWRSLHRVTRTDFTGGDRVLSDKVTTRYEFHGRRGQSPAQLKISSSSGKRTVELARRVDAYRIQQVQFSSSDGTRLTGQFWIPRSAANRAGIVLAHGSGAQDRNGYASILAVLADALVQRGYVVLTYDKRGSARSAGDWTRASFGTLAADLTAGLNTLRARKDLVDPSRVGIGGSSQAGWISAKAVAEGAKPAFVFLTGAGGSAMPVTVQNRFNVAVTMRCAGFTEKQIAAVLDQNEAFYAFRRNPRGAAILDAKTAAAKGDAKLADWLLPDSRSVDATGAAWYSVMEIDFDPIPVWKAFPGKLVFVQGDQDDQTPVDVVRERLAGFDPNKLSLTILEGGQHVGLRAKDVCQGARLEELSTFHPGLFETIAKMSVP